MSIDMREREGERESEGWSSGAHYYQHAREPILEGVTVEMV